MHFSILFLVPVFIYSFIYLFFGAFCFGFGFWFFDRWILSVFGGCRQPILGTGDLGDWNPLVYVFMQGVYLIMYDSGCIFAGFISLDASHGRILNNMLSQRYQGFFRVLIRPLL